MKLLVSAFLILCLASFSATTRESVLNASPVGKYPQVLLLVNADPGFPFWDSQVEFALAVAKAFNIELSVHYIPINHRDRFGIANYIRKHLGQRPVKPDLIISAFWFGAEKKLLDVLQQLNIPLFSINSHLTEEQVSVLGGPRHRYSSWLGHLSPNDVKAGAEIAQRLIYRISQHKNCSIRQCAVNLVGLSGLHHAAVSLQRVEGLELAVQKNAGAELLNVVYANWRRKIAESMTSRILDRHRDIDGIWVASDIMAMGVADALAQKSAYPAIQIGSIDWSPEAIQMIRDDRLSFSLGGHFMEAGWALIMYHDMLRGLDFVDQFGTIVESQLSVLDKSNVAKWGPFLSTTQWSESILKKISKAANPDIALYRLDPAYIINQHIN